MNVSPFYRLQLVARPDSFFVSFVLIYHVLRYRCLPTVVNLQQISDLRQKTSGAYKSFTEHALHTITPPHIAQQEAF
jgi:hypothetical protein